MERRDTELFTRMGRDIPKPKDYQAFQRGCAILFKHELKDPTLQEFGRSGQDQGGIDLLGRRNNDADQMVGIQCRLRLKPDALDKILKDCRAAIALDLDLKEIIFATTAPPNTKATRTAHDAERRLRSEGYNLKVVVYGRETLQDLIAQHVDAYLYFFPAAAATSAQLRHPSERPEADEIAASVITQLKSQGLVGVFQSTASDDLSSEDPRLHARIDTYRTLFKDDGEAPAAERRLVEILEKEDLMSRPWARYRIQALLGAIACPATFGTAPALPRLNGCLRVNPLPRLDAP